MKKYQKEGEGQGLKNNKKSKHNEVTQASGKFRKVKFKAEDDQKN